ncbi:MAG: hypothetical protein RML34_08680 [Leptospiraceae bacterium]|nr:hypothetical protein [Leptospiraceae bacterium]
MRINPQEKLPPFLYEAAIYIYEKMKKAGFECYLVGGCVRDMLLNRRVQDLDFATNARPEKITKIFTHTIPLGAAYGTVIVVYKKKPFEITTYRREMHYTDGRRPEKIEFGKTLEEDVIRRDFTINGLALSLETGEILDFVGGWKDLQAKIIRTIGDPLERFSEDGLRPIRGCRFAACLDFHLAPETARAMPYARSTIARVAHERFYDEWKKTQRNCHRFRFFSLLKENQILEIFMGRLYPYLENESIWFKLEKYLQNEPLNMAIYAAYILAAIIGLPERQLSPPFASVAKAFFREIRFPQTLAKLALSLCHSPLYQVLSEKPFAQAKLKNALSEVEPAWRHYHIRFMRDIWPNKETIKEFYRLLWDIRKEPLYIRQLAINGNDLKTLGFTGPQIGQLLRLLLAHIHERPEENQKSLLLEKAKKLGEEIKMTSL